MALEFEVSQNPLKPTLKLRFREGFGISGETSGPDHKEGDTSHHSHGLFLDLEPIDAVLRRPKQLDGTT